MSARLNYDELINSRRRLTTAFNDPSIVRQSKHRLRGGDEATFYFDFDIATNDPERCADIVRNYSTKLLEISMKRKIDFIAFVEKMGRATVGAIRLAGAISIDAGIPSFIIRLGKELPFERIKLYGIEGTPAAQKLTGFNIALITDHMTSGAETIHTVKAVEMVGGHISDIISYSMKPNSTKETIGFFLDKNIIIHSIYYMYDLPDGTYGSIRGGTIESKDEIITFES